MKKSVKGIIAVLIVVAAGAAALKLVSGKEQPVEAHKVQETVVEEKVQVENVITGDDTMGDELAKVKELLEKLNRGEITQEEFDEKLAETGMTVELKE